jgi:hypothetical protein
VKNNIIIIIMLKKINNASRLIRTFRTNKDSGKVKIRSLLYASAYKGNELEFEIKNIVNDISKKELDINAKVG